VDESSKLQVGLNYQLYYRLHDILWNISNLLQLNVVCIASLHDAACDTKIKVKMFV